MKFWSESSISVVIPCYNAAQTIRRAIHSVSQQTLLPSEVILVDDFSSDETASVLRDLQKSVDQFSIKVISMTNNLGASAARNIGLVNAKSKYIAFLDSDDIWHPDKLLCQHSWMENNPTAVLLAHRSLVYGEESWLSKYTPLQFEQSTEYVTFKQLLLKTQFSTPSVMIRNDASVRFDPNLRYAEDYDCWLRVASADRGVYVSDLPLACLFKARFGDSGLSSHMWRMQRGVMEVYWKLFSDGHISLGWLLLCEIRSVLAFCRRLILKFRWKSVREA